MAKISRFKLSHKQKNYLVNEFWEDVASLDDPEAVRTFFEPFFTPIEPVMFAKRLEILKRLRQDQPYEEIMQELKVTPNTVAKMNNILHIASDEFIEILDKHCEDQKERYKKKYKKDYFHPSKRFWPIKQG